MKAGMGTAEPRLAEAIRARRIELGMTTIQDLVDASGITRQGLAPLLRGEVRQYQDRLKIPVCDALRWTHDSIDRLLAGEDPVERPPVIPRDSGPGGLQAQVLALAAQVGDLATELEGLVQVASERIPQLDALSDRVAALEASAQRSTPLSDPDAPGSP